MRRFAIGLTTAAIVVLCATLAMAQPMEISWTVKDGQSVGAQPVISGVPEGESIAFRATINWPIPAGIDTCRVTCKDGATAFDPYVVVSDVANTTNTVTFTGQCYSYRRTIQLFSSVANRTTGEAFFFKDMELTLDPAPAKENPPWSETLGPVITSEWATNTQKLTLPPDLAQWTWQNEKWMYYEPTEIPLTATITRIRKWHPHAPRDLYPSIAVSRLLDGTGAVMQATNLRAYERYVVRMNAGNTNVIYLRTTK